MYKIPDIPSREEVEGSCLIWSGWTFAEKAYDGFIINSVREVERLGMGDWQGGNDEEVDVKEEENYGADQLRQ